MKKKNRFKLGTWITSFNPSALEIISDLEFDWICIDMEHSTINFDQLSILTSIIQKSKIEAWVRVGNNDSLQIKKCLDLGVDGIIIPMIKSEEDAKNAIKFSRYPPVGIRSYGYCKANKYGINFNKYLKRSKNLKVILQIEHFEAIENLEKILSVKNIDGTFIGPYDLSGSINQPGKLNSIKMRKMINMYEKISIGKRKPMGFHQVKINFTELNLKIKRGYKYICIGTDLEFLGNAYRDVMRKFK